MHVCAGAWSTIMVESQLVSMEVLLTTYVHVRTYVCIPYIESQVLILSYVHAYTHIQYRMYKL